MGYVNTVARKLPSDAWMAGEVWIQPSSGLITNRMMPGYDLGPIGALDDGEEIVPLIQALTAVGATAFGMVEAEKAKTNAQHDASAAAAQAAAAQQAQLAAQNPAPAAAAPGSTPAAGGAVPGASPDKGGSNSKLLLYGGLGLGAVVLILLLRR